jgi:hypothetical protein
MTVGSVLTGFIVLVVFKDRFTFKNYYKGKKILWEKLLSKIMNQKLDLKNLPNVY